MSDRFRIKNKRNRKGNDLSEGVDTASSVLEPDEDIDSEELQAPIQQLQDSRFLDAKVRLHRRLIEELNLTAVEKIPEKQVRQQVHALVSEYVLSERLPLNTKELESFADEVFDEMAGLGPIEPLLKDETVDDILINTHNQVYVERFGMLELTPVRFKDEDHLQRIVNKIVSAVGRRVDESRPMVDARLADGSRVNAIIPPLAVDGALVSIRKFSKQPYSLKRLIEVDALRPAIADVLAGAVKSRISMLVSGGTGSGKTTMLNALSNHISNKERLITIEDAAELQLQQPHVGRLETRPENLEGEGEVRQRDLVKNALRMRPDRIIVGEVRGEEAFDMLQAMNTGHEGSMTTIHANSPRDAISRMEQMVAMADMSMTEASTRATIASALQIVIQLERLSDGKRRLTSVSEITGTEGNVIQMQEIYSFVRKGMNAEGKVDGEFWATGIRPKFLDAIILRGIKLSPNLFDPSQPL